MFVPQYYLNINGILLQWTNQQKHYNNNVKNKRHLDLLCHSRYYLSCVLSALLPQEL